MKINPQNLTGIQSLQPAARTHADQIQRAEEIRDAYRDFVGKTFFGQLLKSMRSSLGKPAYFHGGQAEEVFRSQLDQTLADRMTDASADKLADPMFQQQFPNEAKLLANANSPTPTAESLDQLSTLRRF